MDYVNKISALIRMKNAEYTIKACIASIIDYVDEIVVVNNLSTDNSKNIVEEFISKKIKKYNWPFELIRPWTEDAAWLVEDSPHSKIAFSNFALDKCSHDWILKVDSDMVFREVGMEAILNTNFTKPFLGLGGYEVVSPTHRTLDFSGEEPRFWNKTLAGGLKFKKYFNTGGEVIWSDEWDMNNLWGPKFESLGKGPFWMHYGFLTACHPERPNLGLKTVVLNVQHRSEIHASLDKIFNQEEK